MESVIQFFNEARTAANALPERAPGVKSSHARVPGSGSVSISTASL